MLKKSFGKNKFSLIMGLYNNAAFVSEAVSSVLAQTYDNWELVIYDDASVDGSEKIVNRFLFDKRIRFFKNTNNDGCGAVKGRAIEEANGNIIGIIDADDKLHPQALEIMSREYEIDNEYGVVYSDHYECDVNLRSPQIKKFFVKNVIQNSNLVNIKVSHFLTFKKDVYKKTSGMDHELRIAEDKDIIYKLEEVAKIKHLKKPLYFYRLHNKSVTYGTRTLRARGYESLAKYKAYLRRLDSGYFNLSKEEIANELLIGGIMLRLSGDIDLSSYLLKKSFLMKPINIKGYFYLSKSILQEIKHLLWLYKKNLNI